MCLWGEGKEGALGLALFQLCQCPVARDFSTQDPGSVTMLPTSQDYCALPRFYTSVCA